LSKKSNLKPASTKELKRISSLCLDDLRGEESSAELCRQEGIAQELYYKRFKDFLEAGKKRLVGDIAHQAS